MTESYDNWHYEIDQHKIMWLYIDRKNSKVNSLNVAVFSEFEQIIESIPSRALTGLVIASAKPSGFIAGADIEQFTHLKNREDGFKIIRQAQLVLDKLEALSIPTLALINGFCLGGGCEVSLACRYRIAIDQPKTQIGLPEVKLGIHPGWGGTVRLPRLIGAKQAIPFIIRGSVVKAKVAKRLGLVDVVVPERDAKRAASAFMLNQPKKHKPKGIDALSNVAFTRLLWAKIFRKKLAEKVSCAHYPAPFAVIDLWEKHGSSDKAYLAEAHSIADLLMTETSHNLVRLFFLQTQLKALAKQIKFKVTHVHVVGAGIMGGDIAAWCALKGMKVTLQDRGAKYIEPAITRAHALFKKKLKAPRLIEAAMDRLSADIAGAGMKEADVIMEAVFENLKVKQSIFKEAEQQAKEDAVFATNTSSIPLSEIASVLAKPDRLIGVHFFNPVAKMPLVEVVYGEHTEQSSAQKGAAFAGALAKLPLPVKSSPDFLVNRVLAPYLIEAVLILESGVSATDIDKVAVAFGMPMGPIALADTVGLDICLAVAQNLSQNYPIKVPKVLSAHVEAGDLGVKTGRGFYTYQKGKAQASSEQGKNMSADDLRDRLILSMVNESVACIREKIVESADLLDAGMVFGTGFAPFRGGPIQYAKQRGVKEVINRLESLAKEVGPHFKPDSGWALIK